MSVYWPYYYKSYWLSTNGIIYSWSWYNNYVFYPFNSLINYTNYREPAKFDVE